MRIAALFCLLPAIAAVAAPSTFIKAEHYTALKDYLAPGDVVFAFAVRDRDPETKTARWNETKFRERMELLEAIHDSRVEKALVLSSIEDFRAVMGRIPKDVRWLMYNSEPGMTPAAELENIEASVGGFARIAHAAGMKLDWVPIGMLSPEQEERYLALAPQVDGYLLQHQRVLESQGVEAFAALTRKRAAILRRLNPHCLITVQVVIGRGKLEDLITGLRMVSTIVDSTTIWTMQDTAAAARILEAVRPR